MGGECRDVAGYFARLAPIYGEGAFYRMRRAAVQRAIADEVAGTGLLLDLGCGNGAYTAEFAATARGRGLELRIVGADLSFAMLSAARELRDTAAHFVQVDAAALPFRSRRFDLAFCSHVLQFVPDLALAVSEIASVLRPGGALITTFGVSGLRDELPKIMDPSQWQEFDRTVFAVQRGNEVHVPSERNYGQTFERAGLAVSRRDAPFEPEWSAVEEWLRLRWLSVAEPPVRARVETILDDVRGRSGLSRRFSLNEPLLIGRKPAS